MRATFDAITDAVNNDSVVFDRLYMPHYTSILYNHLKLTPLQAWNLMKSESEANTTDSFYPDAFPGTYDYTESITIGHHSFGRNLTNFFKFLNKFSKAKIILLHNSLDSYFPSAIPETGFQGAAHEVLQIP